MRRRLKDIADIQLGYQPRTKMRPEAGGTHGVVQIKDIRDDDTVAYEGLIRITPEREPQRYGIHEGDVLFIARGSRLRAATVGTPPFPVMAVSFFYILRPRTDVARSAYLAWAINQADVQAQIAKSAMGTGIPHIRRKPVENLRINIPPLEIQRRTVRLDQLLKRDEMLTTRLLEKRRELFTAVCLRASQKDHLKLTCSMGDE